MRKFQSTGERPERPHNAPGLGKSGVLHYIATPVAEDPVLAEHFATEQRVVMLEAPPGQLLLTAACEGGLVYVRGENFEHDWYGTGPTLAAAMRDYLECLEREAALHAATK